MQWNLCEVLGYKHVSVEEDANLSLALGGLTHGSNPLEQAGGYGAIANDGVYIEPTFYTKVVDASGNVYLEPHQERRTVMSKQAAYIVKDILKGPVKSGTATMCWISGMDVAAKTGTTDDNSDRWLCGFTEYYSAAVWYGYDDREEVRWYGDNPAALMWIGVMRPIHDDLPGEKFVKPEGIVTASVCKKTGLLATSNCKASGHAYTEMFVKGTVPKDSCEDDTRKVRICSDSGKLATSYCPHTEWIETTESDKKIGTCTIHTKPANTGIPTIKLNGAGVITLTVGEAYIELRSNCK